MLQVVSACLQAFEVARADHSFTESPFKESWMNTPEFTRNRFIIRAAAGLAAVVVTTSVFIAVALGLTEPPGTADSVQATTTLPKQNG
jgi:hypothetical protein